ncbi:hypothetical protein Godav_023712 [Gossypium davidsonii]|uniref:Gag-pol polyprotein n=2 Tax=Gossypium TaxID=3633 RepID=A0A7J8ST55_GOSDV|nr:hypothetical protein [Gossypium davidsonii]MBA0664794.1 hypothetical protein [Gossypium klotzschianum]
MGMRQEGLRQEYTKVAAKWAIMHTVEKWSIVVPYSKSLPLVNVEGITRKVLRSLPNRFSIEVTAIKEAKNLEQLDINELIGSLQAFEMNLDEVECNGKERKKGIQYYERQGYGNIHSEVAKTLKKKKKSLCVTWSDEDSSSGSQSEKYHQNFITFTTSVIDDDYDEDANCETDNGFLKIYKMMLGNEE